MSLRSHLFDQSHLLCHIAETFLRATQNHMEDDTRTLWFIWTCAEAQVTLALLLFKALLRALKYHPPITEIRKR